MIRPCYTVIGELRKNMVNRMVIAIQNIKLIGRKFKEFISI